MLLPFKLSNLNKQPRKASTILAGDAGATKTNLALYKCEGDQLVLLKEGQYKSNTFKNFIELADTFIKDLPAPDSICIGVAGPVLNGHVKFSNIDWELDSNEIATHFNIQQVFLINDLEATAYGLALLDEKDTTLIQKGSTHAVGNAAVIAPGTGLGEAGIFYDGQFFHPFATEGGHSDFAPRNEFDFELYTYLQKRFGHVSWERLVCGPGIVNIFQFLQHEKKREVPAWLKEKMAAADGAAVISQYSNEVDICKETMQLFIRYLAFESANLVLKMKATGGLFIGGGIIPKIVAVLTNNQFMSSFCASGRMNYLLEKTPVKVIMNTKTALLGAAFYAANIKTV